MPRRRSQARRAQNPGPEPAQKVPLAIPQRRRATAAMELSEPAHGASECDPSRPGLLMRKVGEVPTYGAECTCGKVWGWVLTKGAAMASLTAMAQSGCIKCTGGGRS